MERKTLSQLPLGMSATIKKIENEGSIRRRLLDIGLIEGTTIKSVLKSPGGDLIAYFIRGTLIAIRNVDANHIQIEGI